ncbi:hypothetical protein DMENIID0001_158040 [Sergentomyia squamirostris]
MPQKFLGGTLRMSRCTHLSCKLTFPPTFSRHGTFNHHPPTAGFPLNPHSAITQSDCAATKDCVNETEFQPLQGETEP